MFKEMKWYVHGSVGWPSTEPQQAKISLLIFVRLGGKSLIHKPLIKIKKHALPAFDQKVFFVSIL